MSIILGQNAEPSDFINNSEKDATPANDQNRVPKLESNAKLHNSFINPSNFQEFDASGTWTKPTTLALTGEELVVIQAWGGGGSGGKTAGGVSGGGAGGGGGAFVERRVKLSKLGATEAVTVGAGGAAVTGASGAGNTGGTTSFGSLVFAYGGGGGAAPGGGAGGGSSKAAGGAGSASGGAGAGGD